MNTDVKKQTMMNSPKKVGHEEKGKGGGGRSVFYTADAAAAGGNAHSPTVIESAMAGCLNDLTAYLELLHKATGAGTQLAHKFDTLLKETPYSEIAGQFHCGMRDVEEQMTSKQRQIINETEADIDCLCRTQEGKGERSEGVTPDRFSEIGGKCFLRLLQAQYVFFQTNYAKLTQFDNCQTPGDLKCQTSSPATATSPSPPSPVDRSLPGGRSSKPGGSSTAESPRRLRKISSFFSSKFGSQKSSSNSAANQSSFYVDLSKETEPALLEEPRREENASLACQEDSAGQNANTAVCEPHATANAEPKEAARPANAWASVPVKLPELDHVEVTTQEELDIVIDMLSRSYGRPMESIPEVSTPEAARGPANKAVGSQLGPQPPQPPQPPPKVFNPQHPPPGHQLHEDFAPMAPTRPEPRRNSEGFPRDHHKGNTWPFRPHQRGMLDDAQMMQMYGAYGFMPDAEQNNLYMLGGGRPRGLSADATPFLPAANNNMWSVAGMNTTPREWPHYMQGGYEDYEQASKHWSTVADSSSCSDESSSNGEMTWMMGLNVPPVTNGKRRHSSGEEVMSVSTASNTTLNKSVESLTDPKTKTWPPKHPWGNRPDEAGLGEPIPSSPQLPAHRPLTAQWSDPLNPKGLSVWDPGHMSQNHFAGMAAQLGNQHNHNLLDLDKKY